MSNLLFEAILSKYRSQGTIYNDCIECCQECCPGRIFAQPVWSAVFQPGVSNQNYTDVVTDPHLHLPKQFCFSIRSIRF